MTLKKVGAGFASTAQGKTPGPPFFHPTARVLYFIRYLFLVVKIWQSTKVNVSGVYKRSSTNGCVQGLDNLFWDDNRINALSNAAQNGYEDAVY